MASDYSLGLGIGFRFDPEDLRGQFGELVEAETHEELRYDPKDGKLIGSETVFDTDEGVRYNFLGKDLGVVRHDDNEESYEGETICNAIAEHLKCEVGASHVSFNGTTEVYFSPKMPKELDEGGDFGKVTTGGALPFDAVAKLTPRLKKLEAGLKKLGLKPDKAAIFITYFVS